MSPTRRDALAAAVGGGLLTTAAQAQENLAADAPPRRDPVLSFVPPAVGKAFENVFPGHRCIRMGVRGRDRAAVYRGTFFDPTNWSVTEEELVDGGSVRTPPLYHLEVDAVGEVLEETARLIDPTQLPKAVRDAYGKWNPKGVEGRSGHFWLTEVARGQARVYRVAIILSAVKAYRATFREDGAVVEADPAVIP